MLLGLRCISVLEDSAHKWCVSNFCPNYCKAASQLANLPNRQSDFGWKHVLSLAPSPPPFVIIS